jgi:hypothetical protein
MIYTFSVISGFRAIIGSVGVQVAMAIAMLFMVVVPTQSYVTEPYAGADSEMQNKLSSLKIYMMINHFFCGIIIVVG